MDHPDFSQLYAMWRNEGLTPLSVIQGYTNLLLEDGYGPLNDEQRQTLETINRACGQAINCWIHPSNYLRFRSEEKVDFEATSLPEVIEVAVKNLKINDWINNVEVVLPDNLPLAVCRREPKKGLIIAKTV